MPRELGPSWTIFGVRAFPSGSGWWPISDRIRILDFEHSPEQEFNCTLKLSDMLEYYDPEFGKKRIFHDYLTSLVDAWLRDLVYHWNSETPPGAQSLATIGLLSRSKAAIPGARCSLKPILYVETNFAIAIAKGQFDGADVKYFRRMVHALGWLRSQQPSDPPLGQSGTDTARGSEAEGDQKP